MKKISLFIVLFALTFKLFSQENFQAAYLVKMAADTVAGLVEYRGKTNNCNSCVFKNSEGEIVKYGPQSIIAYGFVNGETYRSKRIQTNDQSQSDVFAQLILDGKVRMFVYNDSLYNERIFIENDSLGINELRIVERHPDNTNDIYKHKEYIGYLKVYLADSKTPLDIAHTKLNVKEIEKLLLEYNSQFDTPSKSYPLKMKTKKREKPLVFGIGAGMTYSFGTYRFGGGHPSISYDDTHFNYPGAFLKLSFKFPYFFQGKFSMNTGFGYQKLNYKVEYIWPIVTPQIIDYSQTNIYIPLNFVYEILKTKVTPYVNAGAVLVLNLDEENNNKLISDGDKYLGEINIGSFQNNFTYLLGVGAKFYLGKNMNIDFNLGLTHYLLFRFDTSVYEKKENDELLLIIRSSNTLINRQISTSLSIHYQF